MADVNDSRLDRIEKKIDDLSEAMVSLARAEEKLISVEKNNFAHYERMNRFSEKLDNIELKAENNARTIAVIGKAFWILVPIIASAFIFQQVN